MKRISVKMLLVSAIVMAIMASTARADLVTLDFNELTDGTIVTTQYAAQGVTFELFGGGEQIDLVARSGMVGPHGFGSYCSFDNYLVANFTVPVDYVGVNFSYFETIYSDLAEVNIELYDSGNNLVASAVLPLVNGTMPSGWIEVGSPSPNVVRAVLSGWTDDWASIMPIDWDNFTYGTIPVPEPSTLLLLGSGLVGIFGIGRRKIGR